MKLDAIIDELQEYCFEDKESIKDRKDLFDNYQIEFLDGWIGILLNQYLYKDKYEVYISIKTKDKIACPLLYKSFSNVMDAKMYYNELKNLIDNNNENFVINRCKTRD